MNSPKHQLQTYNRVCLQLTLLALYVSSFHTVGSFQEAVWLLKAKLGLKALGASCFRPVLETSFVTLGQVLLIISADPSVREL